MNVAAKDTHVNTAMLDGEWARVATMLACAEALRTGETLPDDTSEAFEALCQQVEDARMSGAWAALGGHLSKAILDNLTRLDIDILAICLAPLARPALAPRMHSLQPSAGTSWPSLPLLQELLMLGDGDEMGLLFSRLAADAPLVQGGLIHIEGVAPCETLRPSPALSRRILSRDASLAPPDGAHLNRQTGTWDKLILPDDTLARLRDFAAWARHAPLFETEWGARPVHGPLALFSGPSGTGKTFAAAVIADELSRATGAPWALYSLDLGRIMSKYVGETEANLNALLDSLEGRRAILQVDEADGLLGKRGEVSDARDRYANLEVSHMLSRFERHYGPVILTTNLRSNIDNAFLRRFQLVIDFPEPDEAAREKLWQVLLPPNLERADEIDLTRVSEAARLSGGAIENAARYASILAAEASEPLSMRQLARAIWAELKKEPRQVRASEIGSLVEYLPEIAK